MVLNKMYGAWESESASRTCSPGNLFHMAVKPAWVWLKGLWHFLFTQLFSFFSTIQRHCGLSCDVDRLKTTRRGLIGCRRRYWWPTRSPWRSTTLRCEHNTGSLHAIDSDSYKQERNFGLTSGGTNSAEENVAPLGAETKREPPWRYPRQSPGRKRF